MQSIRLADDIRFTLFTGPVLLGRWRILAAFALGALAGANAHAASFDCAKARSFSEHAVCDNPALSALDDSLAAVYKKAYTHAATVPERRTIAEVRDQQWHWRQSHCRDSACVNDWYTRRIAELEADAQAPQTAQNGPVPSSTRPTPPKRTIQATQPVASPALPAPVMASVPTSPTAPAAPAVTNPSRSPLPLPGHDSAASLADLAAPLDLAETPSNSSSTSSSTLLSGAATSHWPGLPALPSTARAPARSYSSNLRTFNNTDRTTLRTIGVMVDF